MYVYNFSLMVCFVYDFVCFTVCFLSFHWRIKDFFYRGVTLGTRASEASEDCGGLCLRENEFGSRMGTRRHRNNLSHTHNNNMK